MKKTLKPGDTKFNPENLPPDSIYEANSTVRWRVDKDGKGLYFCKKERYKIGTSWTQTT